MATPEKTRLVEEFKETLKDCKNFIITDYRGLTVEQISDLRNKLRENGVVYQVVKNNLIKIALKDAKIEGMDEYLFGPSAIAFAQDDPVSPSKILVDFAKGTKLEVKGGFSEGKAIGIDDIKALSSLPSKEVLLSQVLGSLKAPANNLVGVLSGVMRQLVVALSAISEQKK